MTHRHMLVRVAVFVALAVALGACQQKGSPASQARPASDEVSRVRAASLAWDEAHNAADVDRLMQLYAETAISMPYNRPALEGAAAIGADFRDFFTQFEAHHRTSIVSQEVVGDWAIEHGRYEFSASSRVDSTSWTETGKHIVVRKRLDGAWRIQWEIWNTDAPAGP